MKKNYRCMKRSNVVLWFFFFPGILFVLIIISNCEKNKNQIDSLSTSYTAFTVSPILLDRISGIVPLGQLNPPAHTLPTRHQYWYTGTISDNINPNFRALLYSPGKIWVTKISETKYEDREYEYDYCVEFAICKNITGYFGHVTNLSPALKNLIANELSTNCDSYSTTTESLTTCTYNVFYKMDAGELIGSVSYYGTIDFGMDDNNSKLNFANSSRWSYMVTAVNPLNYFSADIRKAIEAKVGNWDGSLFRTTQPIGGTIEYDVVGTAQGTWVIADFDDKIFAESQAVSLVYDNINPSLGAFSIGNIGTNFDSKVLTFQPQDSGFINRKFNQVTADGNVYEYQFTEGSIYIQYLSKGNMIIETGVTFKGAFTNSAICLIR